MALISDQQIRSFVSSLSRFVDQEYEASRVDLMKRWSGSIEERAAKGNAVAGLLVVEVERGARGVLITLKCSSNDARFREGDHVKLTKDRPLESEATLASGRITRVDDTGVELICDKVHVEKGESGLTLDSSAVDLRPFYETAIARVSESEVGRERIIPLLLGAIEPNGASFEELKDSARLQPPLNEFQAEAVIQSAATDLCYLVQGPPGTGKTQVLAALVRRILEKKPNAAILITSFTHRAIDNAVFRVVKAGIARGRVYKVAAVPPSEDIPHVFNINDVDDLKDGGPIVVGATPFALKHRVADIEFDWVIVDEASQMTLPLAVMAMIVGKRWVFFGDDQQMPPVVLSLPASEAIDQSVFGVLKRGGYNTMLQVTYRLPAPLATWPSFEFYDEKLVSAASVADRRLRLPSLPSGLEAILAPDPAAVFISLGHSNATTSSADEADVIARIVLGLDRVGFPVAKIGIVVPYRRQARLIRTTLRRRGISNEKVDAIVADTVERMQGQEREIIVISLTTSSITFASQLSDFLFQPQRLNVAITRPEKKLIVVGSAVWCDSFPREIPAAKIAARFLRNCSVVAAPA